MTVICRAILKPDTAPYRWFVVRVLTWAEIVRTLHKFDRLQNCHSRCFTLKMEHTSFLRPFQLILKPFTCKWLFGIVFLSQPASHSVDKWTFSIGWNISCFFIFLRNATRWSCYIYIWVENIYHKCARYTLQSLATNLFEQQFTTWAISVHLMLLTITALHVIL